MSRLPNLEASLIAAAARLDAQAAPTPLRAASAPSPDPRGAATSRAALSPYGANRGLRATWQRRGRRGRAALTLAGVLVLGTGATGAAHVAGFRFLDPWTTTRSDFEPTGRPGERVALASDPGAAKAWAVSGYLTRGGQLCASATGEAVKGAGAGCGSTDEIAQAVYDPGLAGTLWSSSSVIAGSQNRPRRLVVFGFADERSPAITVQGPGGPVQARLGDRTLRVAVEKRPDGLSPAGRKVLGALPSTMRLRLFAAELPVPADFDRDYLIMPPMGQRDSDPPALELTTVKAYADTPADALATDRRQALTRLQGPVTGADARQRRLMPALARPRTASDALPAALVKVVEERRSAFSRYGAQPAESRLLQTTDDGTIGPVYALPARGAICLVGAPVISACTPTVRNFTPGLQSVTCSPTLDPDLRLLYGFPPPGTTAVRLSLRGEEPKILLVDDLLVDVQPRQGPVITKVTWLMGDRERARKSPVPRNSGRDACRRHPGDARGFAEISSGIDGG